jgi:hypothetical protein
MIERESDLFCKLTTSLSAVAASVALCAFASAASGATLKGVVVHKNSRAHSFVVADRQGHLSAVHVKRAPRTGKTVIVTARRLRNGTWSASKVSVGHAAHRARIHGTVTFINAAKRMFVISARGVSLLVHRAHHGRAAAADALPQVGTVVNVDVSVDDSGDVNATRFEQQGLDHNGINLEGAVLAIDTTARTLSVSSDDNGQSGSALTVKVPATFDLTKFRVGDAVELIVSLNSDGSYTLEQSSNDSTSEHAQNPGDQQGNGHGDQQPSAERLCQAEQSDPNFAAMHNGTSFGQYYADNPNEPHDALGRCVDAKASGDGTHPSAAATCLAERNDPNFPATHNGQTFVQAYSTSSDPNQQHPNDAFGHCLDAKHSRGEHGGSGHGASGGD